MGLFSDAINQLKSDIKAYLDARLNLLQLQAIDKSSKLVAVLFAVLIIGTMIFFVAMFLLVLLALALGRYLDDYVLGFAIVTAFNFLLLILVYALRKKILIGPVQDFVIRTLTQDPDDETP